MQFEPGDGINPRTGELEPEMELKMTVMDIYNHRLTARVERKKILFEHNLLEYRINTAKEKKKTKEERDLANKLKPFARMMNHADFEQFTSGIEYEHNLRQAISQLQEWRRMQISDLKMGEKYEADKATRQAKMAANGVVDRFAVQSGRPKPNQIEPASAASALVGLEMPPRPSSGLHTPPYSDSPSVKGEPGKTITNGIPNGVPPKPERFPLQSLDKVTPLKLDSENTADFQLLTDQEQEVCRLLRVQPKAYMVMKDAVMREAMKNGGALKKKNVKEICRIDSSKSNKLFDFFVWSGWIAKA